MKMKLHNAMWPGLVGKGEPGTEPAIGLDQMLDLTCAAEVNGQRYDGVDCFLFLPHLDVHGDDDAILRSAESIQKRGLNVGSLVAPVWEGTVGASAMGSDEDRKKFLEAIKVSCRIAKLYEKQGV